MDSRRPPSLHELPKLVLFLPGVGTGAQVAAMVSFRSTRPNLASNAPSITTGTLEAAVRKAAVRFSDSIKVSGCFGGPRAVHVELRQGNRKASSLHTVQQSGLEHIRAISRRRMRAQCQPSRCSARRGKRRSVL